MKTQVNFRMDEKLLDALRERAEYENRTVTQIVELALIQYLQGIGVSLPGVKIPGILKPPSKGKR